MVPYIAILIVLIVAILFAVYKRVDTFEISTTTLKETDKLSAATDFLLKLLQRIINLQKQLESANNFKAKVTEDVIKQLDLSPSTKDKLVKDVLLDELKQLANLLQQALDEFTKLNPSLQINKLMVKPGEAKDFVVHLDALQLSIKKREDYLNSKLGSIGGVNADDLYGAVGGIKQAIDSSNISDDTARSGDVDMTSSKDKKDYEKEAAPSQTPVQTKEMEERIAKSVATQIKDTLLSQRATHNLAEDTSCPYAAYDSENTAQGKEYQQVKPIQKAPDMSEYIRKDSIPCWNCSLP